MVSVKPAPRSTPHTLDAPTLTTGARQMTTKRKAPITTATFIRCPSPCTNGKHCTETVACTPENCEHKGNWKHTLEHVVHHCAHDFQSGLWVEMDGGGTAICKCGMTAFSHDMRYAPWWIQKNWLQRTWSVTPMEGRNEHQKKSPHFRANKIHAWIWAHFSHSQDRSGKNGIHGTQKETARWTNGRHLPLLYVPDCQGRKWVAKEKPPTKEAWLNPLVGLFFVYASTRS